MIVSGKGPNTALNPALNDAPTTGNAAGPGGLLNETKDQKEASTETQYGDSWKALQGKYGARPEKPREIKKQLGKDDFMRIMITQMKNQDPTQPFKAEQMASQLAQYASVEQLSNLNQAVAKMANQNKPLEHLAMTNMIGKTVTVDRERFPHVEGQTESLNFGLPKDAESVHVSILTDGGDSILEKDLGPHRSGEAVFPWDGLKGNSLPAKGGNYMFRIEAKDGKGQIVQTNSTAQSRVIGVSFEGQEPVFLVGDPAHPDKVTLSNITRIESDSQQSLIPGARSLAEASGQSQNKLQGRGQPAAPGGGAANTATGPGFFGFQPGVGSSSLETAKLPAETAKVLAKFQQMQNGGGTQAGHPPVQGQAPVSRSAPAAEEKGFPNGLSESDDSLTKGGNHK